MFCRKCRSDLITKNGIVHGRQRYLCRSCGFNFTIAHSNGWPSSSKLTVVVSYCCGEAIADLARDCGATPVSVSRWIEEARESIMGDREMVEWMIEALTDAVDFALTIENRAKNEEEVYFEFSEQVAWLKSLFKQRRLLDAKVVPHLEESGSAVNDAEFCAHVTKEVERISDILRKTDYQSPSLRGR
jgi:transposase